MTESTTHKAGFFVMLCLFLTGNLFAQDTLYTKTQAPFPVKVMEINETQIKYKAFSNPDGPVYIIKKSSVTRVVYQNGTVDELAIPLPPPAQMALLPAKPIDWTKGHNTFSVILTDLFFGVASITYERSFLSDRLSFRIPFSMGFISNEGDTNFYDYGSGNDLLNFDFQNQTYYREDKIFSTGIDVFFHPFKQGVVNYFVGPSFGFGQIDYWTQFYTNYPLVEYFYKKDAVNYYSWMIKNGIYFVPSKHLSVTLNLAMGISKLKLKSYGNSAGNVYYYPEDQFSRTVEANISIGYRF